MLEQKGRIVVAEKIFEHGVSLRSAPKQEIPSPNDNDSLASYFRKLLDVAGVGEEANLDAVRLTVISPNYHGVLLADIPTIRDSTASPLAMLFVKKGEWVGVLTGVTDAKPTIPPDPALEELRSAYRSDTIKKLLKLAGQVVLLPVETVAGSTRGAVRGGLLGLIVGTALGTLFPPSVFGLIIAGTTIGATMQTIKDAKSTTAEQVEQISIAAKEIGEKVRAIQEIDREIKGRQQVAGALGQITKNLCPAANLRGIFQVHHEDGESILYVTGYESDVMVDLRSDEESKVGIFISGEDRGNIWFFDLVARTTNMDLLLYYPASGKSCYLALDGERVRQSKEEGHNIPIAGITACAAFYQFSGGQEGTRLFETPRGEP